MPEYPNVSEIRKCIERWIDLSPTETPDPYAPRSSFLREAHKVCDEAEQAVYCTVSGAQVLDMQVLAKLQFIEKVLNG